MIVFLLIFSFLVINSKLSSFTGYESYQSYTSLIYIINSFTIILNFIFISLIIYALIKFKNKSANYLAVLITVFIYLSFVIILKMFINNYYIIEIIAITLAILYSSLKFNKISVLLITLVLLINSLLSIGLNIFI